jgi:hypothetical protein
MAGRRLKSTRLKNTTLRTVHPRWWRSGDFWAKVVLLLIVAAVVVTTILNPHDVSGGG